MVRKESWDGVSRRCLWSPDEGPLPAPWMLQVKEVKVHVWKEDHSRQRQQLEQNNIEMSSSTTQIGNPPLPVWLKL